MTNDNTTHLDELIEQERRRFAEKIAKLKRTAAAEQGRVDAKVVELLREEHADIFGDLAERSAELLAAERSKRATRVKRGTPRSRDLVDETAAQTIDPVSEKAASWNK